MNNSSVSSPFLALRQSTAPPSIAELPFVVSLPLSPPEGSNAAAPNDAAQPRHYTTDTIDSPTFSGHLRNEGPPVVSIMSPATVAASVRIESTPLSTLTPMLPLPNHQFHLANIQPAVPPQPANEASADSAPWWVPQEGSSIHAPLETPPPPVRVNSESRRHTREHSLTTLPPELSEVVENTLKWKLLPVMCFLTFGIYYTMDFPASIGTGDGVTIQSLFNSKNLQYNQAMNQALYSVYSYPNTVLAIFGGLLIDKYIGLRKSMLLFTMLVMMGSVFFFVAVHLTNYPLLLAARFLFGLGGECLFVAKSAYVARWFRGGSGLALALGITISFSRVGSSFNFLFSPRIADAYNVQIACVAGVAACLLSLIACIVLIFADIYAVKKGMIKAEAVGNAEESGEVMKFKDLLKLPLELWLICAICIFCYCAIFPFVGIAKNYFQVKYSMSGADATAWISLYQFASAGASPIIGFVVDQTGRYPQWLAAASGCFALTFLLLLSSQSPNVGMAAMPTMGLFYSFLVSGLWPSVPFAVAENMCGMAYGIITALQNFGLATIPLVVGIALDAHTLPPSPEHPIPLPSMKGYSIAISVCIGCACNAFLASMLLWFVDVRKGMRLITSNSKARRDLRGWLGGRGILSSSPALRDSLLKQMHHADSTDNESSASNDELNRTAVVLVRRSLSCESSTNAREHTDASFLSIYLSELRNGLDDILANITKPKGIACICIIFVLMNTFPLSTSVAVVAPTQQAPPTTTAPSTASVAA